MDLRSLYYILAHKLYYHKRDIEYMCAVQQAPKTHQLDDKWHEKFKILSFRSQLGSSLEKVSLMIRDTQSLIPELLLLSKGMLFEAFYFSEQ